MLGDPAKLCQNAGNPVGPPGSMKLDGLVMEPKLDGFRLLAHVTSSGVDFFTRTGKSQRGKLPHIEAALKGLPEHTWLDGELVAYDDKGLPEWGKVQSCMGSNAGDPHGILCYVVFDVLSFDSLDIRRLPLSERREVIQVAVPKGSHIRHSEQHKADHAYHDRLVAEGYEGTIVKDPTKPYASGKRGQGWTKLKASDEMDVVIMGFKDGESSFTGLVGAIEFGQFKPGDKVITYRGRCSGMDMKFRKELTANPQKYIGQVISLAFMGIMPSGSPRHPQYKRLRTDKPAEECVWT